jgi:cytochrome c oxidase assembly protein subunit 15
MSTDIVLDKKTKRLVLIWLAAVAFLIASTVVVGGITRLTNSGLSITEWKPIMGAIPPLNENDWNEAFQKYQQIPEFQIEHNHFDLEDFKFIFFWEYLHRNLGRLIGLVVMIPFFFFLFTKKLPKSLLSRIAIGILLGGLQGALGWFMVSSGLSERVDVSHYRLAAHLLLAFVIFVYFIYLILDIVYSEHLSIQKNDSAQVKSLRKVVGGFHGILTLQIVYGAFVAGLRAGYGHNTYPLMNGSFFPVDGLSIEPIWRNFFENPSTVQFVHRWLGALLVIYVLRIFLIARKVALNPMQRHAVRILAGAITAQFLLGVATVVFHMPMAVASAHQLVGLLVFGAAAHLSYMLRRGPSVRAQS